MQKSILAALFLTSFLLMGHASMKPPKWIKSTNDDQLIISFRDGKLNINNTQNLDSWAYHGIVLSNVECSSEKATLTQVKFKLKLIKGSYGMFFLSAHGTNVLFQKRSRGGFYNTTNEESKSNKPLVSNKYDEFGNESEEWHTMKVLYVPWEGKVYSFINDNPLSIYKKASPRTSFRQAISSPNKGAKFTVNTQEFSSKLIEKKMVKNLIKLFEDMNKLKTGLSPEKILINLMAAIKANNYNNFIENSTEEFKTALTKNALENVHKQLSQQLKSGYKSNYLGKLNQYGYVVHLWKISFYDNRNEALAKLSIQGNRIAGFLIQ